MDNNQRNNPYGYNRPPQNSGQPGGHYNQPQQRPPQQPGGYYGQPQQRPPQQPGGYYGQPQQRPPQQPGGYYGQPQQRPPQQPGGYYGQPQQRPPQQPGGYYGQPQQRPPQQPGGYYNQPYQLSGQPRREASQSTAPTKKSDIKKSKKQAEKQAKEEKKLKKAQNGKGKKKGIIVAISLLLVVAIIAGTVGIVSVVLNGDFTKYVSTNNATVDAGAVADVTFKDNVNIIADTEKVQEDFKEVTVKGDEYTVIYSSKLPSELSALKKGEIFCVPSIEGAQYNCFEMGFCGEVISHDADSITFKVPSMEKVFSDFSFNLDGGVADTAEFTPAAGVSVVENTPILKSNFNTLAATPNIPLAKEYNYDASVDIGDYRISPEFSFTEPSKKSVLPGYSLFCDNLKLKLSLEKVVNGSSETAISGTVEMKDLATKMDIEWHEDEDGNQEVERFDVGFMANAKTTLEYTDTISAGLDDLPKASELNDIPSKGEKILQIEDVTDNEKGKIVLGSYVIGYNVKLPGLVNADNKIGYLSAGIVIQFFVSASGEIYTECTLTNSGFYRAEYNSEDGFVGEAKGYDYPSPAVYTGEYTQEMLDSKPNTTFEVEAQVKLNAATGIDVGLCILGMVPVKIANNLVEAEAVFDIDSKVEIFDLADLDASFLFDCAESVVVKSNSTLKIYLGAKCKLPIEMTIASFGFEKLLYEKEWFRYPNPIPFDQSQCGFGNIYVGESYTAEEMDVIYKAFEKEQNIDSIISGVTDEIGNAVVDTFKYELNSILSQADIDLYEAMYGSVKYYSSGALYFLDEDGTVILSVITGEGVCNAGGLEVDTKPEFAEKLYSTPDDSTTIKLDISEEIRAILSSELGFDLGVENQDLTIYTYVAEDTGNEMMLLYSGGDLAAIIVAEV